jgi:hypothetical protein
MRQYLKFQSFGLVFLLAFYMVTSVLFLSISFIETTDNTTWLETMGIVTLTYALIQLGVHMIIGLIASTEKIGIMKCFKERS